MHHHRLTGLVPFILAMLPASVTAQDLLWQKDFGGTDYDRLFSVVQTADGGFVAGGLSRSQNISVSQYNHGQEDYLVMKLDSAGNKVWDRFFGGTDAEELNQVIETAGGYLLAGFSLSGATGDKTGYSRGMADWWIVQTNDTGAILWQRTIGGAANDELHAVRNTPDGGYILAGDSYSDLSGDKTENSNGGADCWIVKTDSLGNIQWQNTIGGADDEFLYDVRLAADGGYLLGGWSTSGVSGDKTQASNGGADYWIVKVDTAGVVQWDRAYGGSANDRLHAVLQTADGGYMLGGYSDSDISGDKTENSKGGFDYWVVRTDSAGAILWQKTIGGNLPDRLYAVNETADGGFMLGGQSYSGGSGGSDFLLVRTDSAGTVLWQDTLGGAQDDFLFSMEPTAGGGCIAGGASYSGISGDKTEPNEGLGDFWIVRLADTALTTTVPQVAGPVTAMAVFPNPTGDVLYLLPGGTDLRGTVTVCETAGRQVWRRRVERNGPASAVSLNITNLPPAVYLVEWRSENEVARTVFVRSP